MKCIINWKDLLDIILTVFLLNQEEYIYLKQNVLQEMFC